MAAAAEQFAENGYYKTTTAGVARAVGVTQPYVFHFFKSKEELYLAVLEQATGQILQAFAEVEASANDLREAMGDAFGKLLVNHRNEILLTMMSHAVPEPAIRDVVRSGFEQVYEWLKFRFGQAGFANPGKEASVFIGQGLAIALAETVHLPNLLYSLCPPNDSSTE